eukprot:TRINITY_DN21296_c1_g2_i1.p1 TRINITY_DN21296_c1_g2~~TRINITY_DN21296_c1_g2_i1.p1  ORF type:complete len:182 (-),score=24.14 TRINITY_DN21296_c1_g2_i1:98-643(-)
MATRRCRGISISSRAASALGGRAAAAAAMGLCAALGVLGPVGASAQSCPVVAMQGCFDAQFPCERCCDTRAIPVGDMSCWVDKVKFPYCCGTTRIRMEAARMLPAMDHLASQPPATCPPNAQPHCFDDYFPCERCCDTRRGGQGDLACWPDTTQYGLRTLSYEFCCGLLPFTNEGLELKPW